jgi:hypothetical protein
VSATPRLFGIALFGIKAFSVGHAARIASACSLAARGIEVQTTSASTIALLLMLAASLDNEQIAL